MRIASKRTHSIELRHVIAFSGDPVGDQVVPNLARPGGNITGFSYMSTDLAAKRLKLLSQSFPNDRAAILYNPDEPATRLEMKATETAAQALGVKLLPLAARRSDDITQVFAQVAGERVAGVIVFTHGFAVLNRGRIIEMAARERLPTVYGWRFCRCRWPDVLWAKRSDHGPKSGRIRRPNHQGRAGRQSSS
jgi:putative tryptophan/tyrosine transport system substrate-binding protein